MVEDVGAFGQHSRQRHLFATEVGRQYLNLAARRLRAALANCCRPDPCPIVGQVVAVDARDHGVAQTHLRDRAGNAGRLQRVVPGRLATVDVAEAAAPSAGVAEDHEGRGSAFPAFANVWAGGLLADGVEVLLLDHRRQLAVLLASRRRHLEPRRLARSDRLHVGAEYGAYVHPAGVGARAGLMGADRRLFGHRVRLAPRRSVRSAQPAVRGLVVAVLRPVRLPKRR